MTEGQGMNWDKSQGEGQWGQPAPGGQWSQPAPGGQWGQPAPGVQGYGQPPGPPARTLPPGVELASHGRRIGAYFLAFPLAVVTLGIGYLIWGLIVWGKGTSPALQVLGMRCWNDRDQRPATWGTMALRDIVGGIAQSILSVITLLISFIMFLSSGKRQSLMDVVGGTVVLYDPNKALG